MSWVVYRNKRALQQKYSFKSYKLNEFVKRRKKQNGKVMMTKRSKEKIIAYNQESNWMIGAQALVILYATKWAAKST